MSINERRKENLAKRLLICGHPDLSRSKFSSGLVAGLDRNLFDVHILANHATNKSFDPAKEIQRILRSQKLLVVFPIHWYGSPSLLMRWVEDALLPSGDLAAEKFLRHKLVTFIVSTGGKKSEYTAKGKHKRPICEYLNSIEMTFTYFGSKVQKPQIFHATWQLIDEEVRKISQSLNLI